MKEYTLLAVISVLLTLFLDKKSGTGILKRRESYPFYIIILFFMFLVNGYLTFQYIVIYDPRFFLNVRIGSVPFEDFLFGFSNFKIIEKYCPLFDYTEEERNKFFEEMKRQDKNTPL